MKFRAANAEDQIIKADSMGQQQDSYAFYRTSDNSIVAQIPKDAVLVVVEERSEG